MFPDAGQTSKNVYQELFILCTELWKINSVLTIISVLTGSNTVREQVSAKIPRLN